MMKLGRLAPLSTMVALAGTAACAPRPGVQARCPSTTPPSAGWTTHDEGAFTVQLPPGFTRVRVQGIDSRVGRWEAPGKRVGYDLGAYANPLQRNDLNTFPGLVVCQESDGRGIPRIIRYSPPDGGYAVSAHWPDVRREGPGEATSLTLEGVVQRAEDQGEILAIIRSVRIGGPDGEAAGSVQPPAVGSPGHVGYRASGNEPFWTIVFGETTMEFSALGNEDTVRATRPEPETLADGWRFAATAGGSPYVVRIEDRLCDDSMSGRPFPHTVTVTVGGQTYTGCGGDTASLLTGGEWEVDRLEGVEATGGQRPTLQFTPDGVLTGTGSCNRYRATYEITGEGIRIGPAMATRMACVDPEANAQEVRFFSLLDQVTRFEIAEGGGLALLAADRPVIVARR